MRVMMMMTHDLLIQVIILVYESLELNDFYQLSLVRERNGKFGSQGLRMWRRHTGGQQQSVLVPLSHY